MWAKQLFLLCFYFLLFSPICFSNSDDVDALLSFKASLSDPTCSLSSWVYPSDPCSNSWVGVTCNPSTRRVVKLLLDNLNLTGSAQPLCRLTQLRLLSLRNNYLYSSELNLSSWPNIKHLYLSHNRFSGFIPTRLPNLRRLRRLDLSFNRFSGEIPMTEFTQLPNLLTLRLEANAFTGTLDSLDSSSPSILDFNVSNNNFSGAIPAWLSRFPVTSFAGNRNLCGRPLLSICSNRTEKPESERSKSRISINRVVLLIVILDALAIVTAAGIVTYCLCKRIRSRRSGAVHREVGNGDHHGRHCGPIKSGVDEKKMVVFEGCRKGFSNVDGLWKSSAALLGKGSVGSTYKIVKDDGDVAVVKRVRSTRKKKEMYAWLNSIGPLRHNNIVCLRAYCNSKAELLLIYDFQPNGSLHCLLHDNRGPGRIPLDWTTRLKFAADAAKGLAFLHGYNEAKLFHGNLTTSNIVIDQRGNACISDIGLRQLLHTPYFMNSPFKAPEVKLNSNYFTQKCDVYSFGVVLLEILTGKMAKGVGESSIVNWVQKMGPEKWSWELFDFELVKDKRMEGEMRALLQVALLCLALSPEERPKMSVVYRMIEDIKAKGSVQSGINSIMNNPSFDCSSLSMSDSILNSDYSL